MPCPPRQKISPERHAVDTMKTGEEISMLDVIDGTVAEDLAGVLVALEGRVVDVGEIRLTPNNMLRF